MHTCRCAYRHDNGDVEGFSGFGFSEHTAREDCLEQIQRQRLLVPGASEQTFDENKVIYAERELSSKEIEQVRRDWARSRRYGPYGNLYPD